jgi:hypothetical protein
MSRFEAEGSAAARHALNNLFAKILGAAELALYQSGEPLARSELENIVGLAEEGGSLVAELNFTARKL